MADAMGGAGGQIRIDAFRNQAAASNATKGHFRVDGEGVLSIKSIRVSNRGGGGDQKRAAKAAFDNALHSFFLGDQAKIDAVKRAIDPELDSRGALDLKKVRSFFTEGAGRDNIGLQRFATDAVRTQEARAEHAERIRTTLSAHGVSDRAIDKILVGKNSASLTVKMSLQPQDYKQYVNLQESISQFLGPENHRPTIDLTLKGPDSPQQSSLGIVGGTGPLSDAAMLDKAMSKLLRAGANPDSIHVRLLSAPPPRKFYEKFNTVPLTRYITRVKFFCQQPGADGGAYQANHKAICLASNTAHGKIGDVGANFTSGTVRGMLKDRFHDRVQDLVAGVVDYVAATPPGNEIESRPLVLGTDAAYDDNLYPHRFDAISVASQVVEKGANGDEAALTREQLLDPEIVSSLNHKNLQGFINDAKQNGPDPTGRIGARLEELIRQQIDSADPKPTHVILGCTELPLALGHERIEALNADENLGVKFIDTEEFFAERYAELIADDTTGVERNNLQRHYVAGEG